MRSLAAALAIILLFPLLAGATDFTSTSFIVKDPVIEGLGGYSSSTSFRLWGTIPFIEPRTNTSTTFINLPGFLNFSDAAATSATSTPAGGGGGGGGIAPEVLPKPVKPKPSDRIISRLDCNGDKRINLVDLSCLLYYADKTGPIIEPYDFNSDSVVDLIDVSILLYYWYDPVVTTEL